MALGRRRSAGRNRRKGYYITWLGNGSGREDSGLGGSDWDSFSSFQRRGEKKEGKKKSLKRKRQVRTGEQNDRKQTSGPVGRGGLRANKVGLGDE